MGVYLPNMDMPTTPVLFCIHPDGKVFADLEGGWREYQAIPVPPHGRLIDADALDNTLGIEDRDGWVRWTLEDAPTIIPADTEKEER